MNQNLLTLSHGPLVWENTLPPAFKGLRLPGGTLASATGSFGSVCIQEFQADNYSIRFNVFDILQRFIARTSAKESGFHSRIILKGRVDHEMQHLGKWSLRQNQFTVLQAAGPEVTSFYDKNIHISFDAFFSMKLVSELFPLFPSINKQLSQNPVLIAASKWADAETLELVHSFLHCKYEKNFRRHFFESRIRDLLFKYLVQSANRQPDEKEPREKEMEAIYKAEEIISSNIAAHTPIPELSKKVLLNEFRLKQLFKTVFGMGPYEYLIRKRLEKAKELLENGLSVKEVAAQVGYRPSDFTTAFRKHFGFPPSIIKKRNL